MTGTREMSAAEIADAHARRKEAERLQTIEGNPLTAEEMAMFEMFEREGWSHEKRRAYIQACFARSGGQTAAE